MAFKWARSHVLYTHTHTQLSSAKHFYESGRSMVEMLGVLAVMGILGLTGVWAYNSAINRHRANELIYEAQKRATVVAMQITAGNAILSIGEFKNSAGYTFGVEKNPQNVNQFNITINGVDAKVCQQIKNAIGEGSQIRVVSEFCDKLTFNNDLSTTAYASDYAINENTCTGAGYTWCTKGNDGIETKCSENTNCCSSISYDTGCQTCDTTTGEVTNKTDGSACLYKNKTSTCNAGTCLDPDITTSTKCLTNDHCGGMGSGYFCQYTTQDGDTYCTENAPVAMGCGDKTPATCDKAGVCALIGTVTKVNVAGLGHVLVGDPIGRWWNNDNWCKALGKSLIPIEAFQVYYNHGMTLLTTGTGKTPFTCRQGKDCDRWDAGYAANAMWEGNGATLTDATDENGELYREKYSPVVLALAQQFRGQKHAFFTASPPSTMCKVFLVDLNRGFINTSDRSYQSSHALCR